MARDETASFHYIEWQDLYEKEKPFEILADLPDGFPDSRKTNIVLKENSPERIKDVRGHEADFSLDDHGFAFRNIETSFLEYDKRRLVEAEFLPGVVEPFLREHVEGADRIVFFDWHLRRNVREEAPAAIDINDGSHALLPVNYAHIDQSPASTVNRVRAQLGDEAEELLKGRVRIVNFWKPLWRPVLDAPLALCDGSTITEDNVVYADHIRQYYIGETVFLKPLPNHAWHYLSNQTQNEVTLIKIFDSDESSKAKWCPHASFTHSLIGIGAQPRESIEVRALIFTYPNTK